MGPSPLLQQERTGTERVAGTGSRSGGGVFRDSPVPLHFQLQNLLLGMIERGEVRPDRPFPPERELAAQFGVSLAPVRQAILDLVKEGVLYRVRGRGTFLRERSLLEQDSVLSSFTESMRAKGLEVEMQVLREETVEPERAVAEALRTSEGRVHAIERLARVEGDPVALLTSFLLARRFPGFGRKLAARGSLYHAIKDDFGIVPVRAETTVEVGRCTIAQSSLLGVPSGSSVLVATGTTYDADDLAVEHFRVVYRADRIRLRLDTCRYAESVVPDATQSRAASTDARRDVHDGAVG